MYETRTDRQIPDPKMANNKYMMPALIIGVILVASGTIDLGGIFGGTTPAQPAPYTGDCNSVPTIAVSAVDEQEHGRAIGDITTRYLVNGQYFASAPGTFSEGDSVSLLITNATMVDKIIPAFTLGCGANNVQVQLGDYTEGTVEILEESTTLTDVAVAADSNASTIALGGSDTYRLKVTGTDKDTTGDQIFIVEVSENANVSAITLVNSAGSAVPTIGVPSSYTNTLTSPKVVAFKVPAMTSATEYEYKLTLAARSGKKIAGAVYTTFLSGQAFVEDDGTFVSWGVEQLDGDTTHQTEYDYDFWIAEV